MKLLRLLLFPFSLFYGLVTLIRNFMYDQGLLKSRAFQFPVIVVGNLEVGGSGKTPLIEYLIRLLKERYRVAVLSRGYGRSSHGFIRAERTAKDVSAPAPWPSASLIGDEPFQYYLKFPEITVAVGADRVAAVERLRQDHDLILLDDAFQHRSLKPGFSILVFDYNTLFKPRFLLPTGNYREAFRGRKRADVLLVSKAPMNLSKAEKAAVQRRLALAANQHLVFSSLEYDELKMLDPHQPPVTIRRETRVLLVTGIARPGPLLRKLQALTPHLTHLKYPDHHSFTEKNIAKIAGEFKRIESPDKVILTTEKDAARLRGQIASTALEQLPLAYLPVRVRIHEAERQRFEEVILNYVERNNFKVQV